MTLLGMTEQQQINIMMDNLQLHMNLIAHLQDRVLQLELISLKEETK